MNKRERSTIKSIIIILEHEARIDLKQYRYHLNNRMTNGENYHLGKFDAFAKSIYTISKLLK